jgi:hypothetical protein
VRGLTGLRALHIRFYFSKIRITYVAHVRSGGYRPVKDDILFEKQRIDDTTLLPGMADVACQCNKILALSATR